MKSIRFICIALLWAFFALLSPVQALPPAWYSVGTETGATTNLFADSTELQDSFANLNVQLEQAVSKSILFYYSGFGELIYANNELGSSRHELGAEWGQQLGKRNELWLALNGWILDYGDKYESYNRNAVKGVLGFRRVMSEAVRIRARWGESAIQFPQLGDLNVDYLDSYVLAGCNFATTFRMGFDLETGYKQRNYHKLSSETATDYYWLSFRASRQLTPGLGLSLRGLLREQISVENDAIYALLSGGINPGDLLWDGWRMYAALNFRPSEWGRNVEWDKREEVAQREGVREDEHARGNRAKGGEKSWLTRCWRATLGGFHRGALNVAYGKSDYVGTESLTGLIGRNDTLTEVNLSLERDLLPSMRTFFFTLGVGGGWTRNSSNDSYFDYQSFNGFCWIRIERL